MFQFDPFHEKHKIVLAQNRHSNTPQSKNPTQC